MADTQPGRPRVPAETRRPLPEPPARSLPALPAAGRRPLPPGARGTCRAARAPWLPRGGRRGQAAAVPPLCCSLCTCRCRRGFPRAAGAGGGGQGRPLEGPGCLGRPAAVRARRAPQRGGDADAGVQRGGEACGGSLCCSAQREPSCGSPAAEPHGAQCAGGAARDAGALPASDGVSGRDEEPKKAMPGLLFCKRAVSRNIKV